MKTLFKCLIASKLEPLAVQNEKENFTVPLVNNRKLLFSTTQMWIIWTTKSWITELLRLGGTSGDYTVQPPAQSGDDQRALIRDYVQSKFEYFQGWTLHNFSVQPVPVLNHCHTKKSVFLRLNWIVFQALSLFLSQLLMRRAWLHLFHWSPHPSQVFIHIYTAKIPLSHLLSRLNSTSSSSLSSYVKLSLTALTA